MWLGLGLELAYIQTAKRLKKALFFGQFNFSFTYQTSSRNIKPDALFCQHVTEKSSSTLDTILPSTCVVAALSWESESVVREAQQTQSDPGKSPPKSPKCLFVLDSVRSQVPQEVDTSRFACHQGISHTLSLLKRHFWWPMELWKQIPMPLSLLACSVLEERPLIIHLLACYAFYLFQVVPGPTLLSTCYQSSSITM